MNKKYKVSEIEVCTAKKDDMVAVADMIQELADFEKMPDGPKISASVLEHDGFEKQPPAFSCKVARLRLDAAVADVAASVVGYALYFPTYSTWEGPALMLEDLYVRPHHRRCGIGEMLFNAVAKEAGATGCSRLDFHVLEWNPARAFYERKGAVNLTRSERWCYYRLSGAPLRHLADQH